VDQRRMQNAKQLKRDQIIINICVRYGSLLLKGTVPFIEIDSAGTGDIQNVHLLSKHEGQIFSSAYNSMQ
jgi:hypothetical protein